MEVWKKFRANFNPTLIPKLLGQAIVDRNYQVGRKWVGAYNILYATTFFLLFLLTVHLEDVEAKGYNFISKLNFYAQFYGMTIFMCFLSVSVTFWKKDIFSCLQDLLRQLKELKSLEAESPVHFPYTRIVIMTVILVLTQPIFLVFDLINNQQHTFLFWLCLYLPGLAINIYVADFTAIMAGCTNRFRAINHFLKENLEKSKKTGGVNRLLKKLDSGTVFDKMFELHDETCEIARRVNRACSTEFFIFFLISSMTILSFAYNICLDFVIEARGGKKMMRELYACDYWATMYGFGIVSIIAESINLVKNCEETTKILHRLMNFFPQLDNGDVYALQLNHQKLKITAAGLFKIDQTLIYSLVSAWATYLLILIQFSSQP